MDGARRPRSEERKGLRAEPLHRPESRGERRREVTEPRPSARSRQSEDVGVHGAEPLRLGERKEGRRRRKREAQREKRSP
eukprot:2663738-Lingulodinium_polyedra.AAC.1